MKFNRKESIELFEVFGYHTEEVEPESVTCWDSSALQRCWKVSTGVSYQLCSSQRLIDWAFAVAASKNEVMEVAIRFLLDDCKTFHLGLPWYQLKGYQEMNLLELAVESGLTVEYLIEGIKKNGSQA